MGGFVVCGEIVYSSNHLHNMLVSCRQTETKASGGGVPCKADPAAAKDTISAASGDVKAISHRLNTAHTKSSSGGVPCRNPEPTTLPGYGLKMFPAIDGLDTRFIGHKVNKKKVAEVTERLSSATTRASRARLENHRILLYPERTLLFNDTERIVQFQESGVVVKQKDMSAREKWYN